MLESNSYESFAGQLIINTHQNSNLEKIGERERENRKGIPFLVIAMIHSLGFC